VDVMLSKNMILLKLRGS